MSNLNFNIFKQFLMLDLLDIEAEQSLRNIAWDALPESLRTLRVENIGEPIPQNAFSNLTNLMDFSLSGWLIGNLHQNTFKNQHNLRFLHLLECGITELHPELFSSLHRLQHLSLSFNQIEELPAGVFANLENLGDGDWNNLFLMNNKIRRINRNSFGVHPKLTKIYLSENQIYEIERGIFNQSFPNLRTFSVIFNECVSTVIVRDFDVSPDLEYCFANWAGETTRTTTTDDSGKMRINFYSFIFVAIFMFLI